MQSNRQGGKSSIDKTSGLGKDNRPPDDAAKNTLRAEARDLLKSELAGFAKEQASGSSENTPKLIRTLEYGKSTPDFAGVRDPDALANLSEDERKSWQALWTDVEAMLKQANAK